MAQMLSLSSTRWQDTYITREVRRRVWWTLFMADRWCSSGLGLPRQLDDSSSSPESLPTDEHLFHAAFDDNDERRPSSPKLGLWAYMIRLVDIFGSVLDLNRRLIRCSDDSVEGDVLALSQRFEAWEAELPIDKQFNLTNLIEWHHRSHGGTFVALHLGFHHYQTLLYFQYLHNTRSTRSVQYAASCRQHAIEFARLLRVSRERRIACSYPTIGHMALVSSAVLIHTLLYGDDQNLADVRALLVSNFEVITELKEQWPCLQRTVSLSEYFLATAWLTRG